MSNTNTASLAYQRETTYGVTPSHPQLKLIRLTKESFERDKSTQRSAEIRSDRQNGEALETGIKAVGGFEFELSVGGQEDFMEDALQGTWTDVAGTLTLTNGSTLRSYVVEKGLTSAAWEIFKGSCIDTFNLNLVSQKIIDGKFTFLGQNTTSAALSISGLAYGTLTLTGQPLNAETVTVGGKVYTFQTVLTNVANNVFIGANFAASLVNLAAAINRTAGAGTLYAAATTINANVSAAVTATTLIATALLSGTAGNAIASTATLTNGAWGAVTLLSGSAYTPAPTGLIMTSSAHVANILEGGAALSSVKSLSFTATNNLRANDVIGQKYLDEVGVGSFMVSGKLETYFRTKALYDEFIAHTTTSLSFECSRTAPGAVSGDVIGYRFTLPAIRYTKAPRILSGKDSDVMVSMDWEAEASGTTTMKIEKLLMP